MNYSSVSAIRLNPANPDHHLWNNNGTWFVHYTTHPTPVTKERTRTSLRTKIVSEARRRRDRVLASLGRELSHATPTAISSEVQQ